MLHLSVRLTADQYHKLNEIIEKLGFQNLETSENKNETFRVFIDKLHDIYVVKNPVTVPNSQKPFDSEKWYCECPEGTYLKDKKKVHCRTTIKSILEWLPRNRLVDPPVCDECFTVDRYGTYASFQTWMQKKLEKPETSSQWICVRDLPPHPNAEMQKAQCEICRLKHHDDWKACQELKRCYEAHKNDPARG